MIAKGCKPAVHEASISLRMCFAWPRCLATLKGLNWVQPQVRFSQKQTLRWGL